jgi:hypothetical protein
VSPTKVVFNSLSVEFFIDGRAKFFIPLQYLHIPYDMQNFNKLKSQQVKQILKPLNTQANIDDVLLIKFFDIQALWTMVKLLLNFYQTWYGAEIEQNSLRVSIMMNHIWRSLPFYDSDEWASHVQKFGLPIQNVDSIKIPNGNWKLILDKFPIWPTVCSSLRAGFGLPIDFFFNTLFAKEESQNQ